MIALYRQFVGAGDLSFDVGANTGSRISVLRALGARVVAVEPQSSCIAELRDRFGSDPAVTIVPKALGRSPGTAEMLISQARSISSLSERWVSAVRSSGRFAAYSWDSSETVAVSNLDELIEEYGLPRFCKIDVEGFEAEVLAGLTRPIQALSFEFISELRETAFECIDLVSKLGNYEFNYDVDESMQLRLTSWEGPADLKRRLAAMVNAPNHFFDVYARLRS
jgi:FkbM family methyltransferase